MILAYSANIILFFTIFTSLLSITLQKKNKSLNNSHYIISLLNISLFIQLIYAFITSNYHIENVVLNSHHLKPLIFKIAGSWGSHEGSLILIYMLTSVMFSIFAYKNKPNNTQKTIYFSSIGFLGTYILFSSNPFRIVTEEVTNGMGLNPLLQDYALAIHPPILYIGYTSLIVPFLIAFYDKETFLEKHKYLHKWALFSFSFLTLGIGLGSWWAYRELGWGGFWFWDPVENISLLPWFTAVGLVHLLISKNSSFYKYQILLCILGFFYANFATFIVRSGLLTSVHSFAQDNSRGIYLLLYIIGIGCIGIIPVIKAFKENVIINKNRFLLANAIFMFLGSIIIFFALTSPIIYYMLYKQFISLGAPYYEKTLLPVMSPVLFLGSVAVTKYITQKQLFLKMLSVALLSGILTYLCSKHYTIHSLLPVYGILGAWFLIIFSILDFLQNMRRIAVFLGHIGFGLLILSANIAFNGSTFEEATLKIGESFEHNNYQITLKDVEYSLVKNYASRKAIVKITKNNYIFYLKPETRLYPIEQTTTTDVDIKSFLFNDIYLAFADYDEEKGAYLRVYDRKMINFIWLSVALMFASGIYKILRKKK
ncbi:MAG: heme lyase CcmF/NrfE family subunit [Alphaproteobacteria bacterium]|nr:heme lyase CcmF/NrfE family subunit [Alphaproteobacteria bacterium]OJV15285.1 MAG: hypothetical protein BGO27_02115 [Alphaproteobacteria bacterium 33-17]